MDFQLLISNLTNPTLLFFILGVLAFLMKSDLEVPAPSKSFIALYLLFSIGFNGGQELGSSQFDQEIIYSLIFGVLISMGIPLYTFFILKRKLNAADAGAIAASYGSVSAVTFVTAVSFLEMQDIPFNGHMVAVMALMEFPAIMMGVILMKSFNDEPTYVKTVSLKSTIWHSISNGS